MYHAEVLSKFPVVQHFPFGSLFSWEQDPAAAAARHSVPTADHSVSQSTSSSTSTTRQPPLEGTKAPWAQAPRATKAPMIAPFTKQTSLGSMAPKTAPWATPSSNALQTEMPPTRAPWASNNAPFTSQVSIRAGPPDGPTRAPWADQEASEGR